MKTDRTRAKSLMAIVASAVLSMAAPGYAGGSISEKEFNEAIAALNKAYHDAKIPDAYKYPFKIIGDWSSPSMRVKYAPPGKKHGQVTLPGNLARSIDAGPDSFTMVLCYEAGRAFAGFPDIFAGRDRRITLSSLGNADYYITAVCTRLLWQDQREKNAAFRAKADPETKAFCDEIFPDQTDAQNLCYRQALAVRPWAKFLNRDRAVSFGKPEQRIVQKMYTGHPTGQCRFDTMLAGIACKGYDRWDHYSYPKNYAELAEKSCTGEYTSDPKVTIRNGLRPRCWYLPAP